MSNRNKTDYVKKFNRLVEPEYTDAVEIEEVQPEVIEETEEFEVITKEGIVNINANQTLNLRSEMDTNAIIVKQLNSKELVIIDNEYTDWYHVVTESGAEGYVMSKFIELV